MKKDTATLALRVIDLVLAGGTLAATAHARAQASRTKIQTMIDEDRDPTPAEWDEILGEGDTLARSIEEAVRLKRLDPRWQAPEDN